jgi:glucosylceramidase
MTKSFLTMTVLIGLLSLQSNCSKDKKPAPPTNPVEPPVSAGNISYWVTKGDQSMLLQKQSKDLQITSPNNSYSHIVVDSTQLFQTVEGFGYTLTGGSAILLRQLSPAGRASVLQELFGNGENSIGVSYLRVSIGASDLSPTVFSYNDLPAGQTDPALNNFSLSQDTLDLIPVLKEILAINPNIKIMGSPWSPPVWMKDNKSSVGGSLLPQYYSTYAQYFVKYIQAMKARGITIDAITPQNEPLHPGNNPSMLMTAPQQAEFIKNHLGPAFQAANITTKIIIYDHNCDRPDYPITVLSDAAAAAFIDGSAFHLYAGDISALSTVRNQFPTKNVYFTEQWTGANGNFEGDLKWHTRNVIIGSMRNWSKIALEWNLANDPTYGPHTPGGCTECKGALTIGNGGITKNVAYYIIAHASKFVPAGSVRIASTNVNGLPNAAFLTPAGKKVLIVLNDASSDANFNIRFKEKWTQAMVPANSVATFTW